MKLNKLTKLQPRERIGLSVAALVVLCTLGDRLVLRPINRSVKDFEQRIEVAKSELAIGRGVIDTGSEVRQAYADVEGLVNQSVSASEALADLTGEIDMLAEQAEIEMDSIQRREPTLAGAYQYLTVEIGSFKGSTAGVVKFLHGIETAPGLLRVVRISLAPGEEEDTVQGSLAVTKIAIPEPGSVVEEPVEE